MEGGVLLEGWCRLFLDGLAAAGATELVVSPGSRSTPIVLAGRADPRFSLELVVDERAASFYALGRARVTGRPPVLVRTSGSAGGHDLPAVIEALEAGLPLVIVTADRPRELLGVRSPQTTDQTHLFGTRAVGFFELGRPVESEVALRSARRVGASAAALALGPRPGAVQVNLPADKPLEPGPDRGPDELAFMARVEAILAEPPPRTYGSQRLPSAEGLDALVEAFSSARRPLVVAGPSRPLTAEGRARVLSALERLGAPVVAEATSQLRLGPGGLGGVGLGAAVGVADLSSELAPDLVLQLGDPPVSTGLQRALARWGGRRMAVVTEGYPDPLSRAEVIHGGWAETLEPLAERVRGGFPEFSAAWRGAEQIAKGAVEATLALEGGWNEGVATKIARDAVPAGGRLMVGNSLAVRHLDTLVPPGGEPCEVLHQRGASGIDGLIAGAVGAAKAQPLLLILGDVSARHDLGGMALGPRVGEALTVLVLHNGGGRIFEQLPIAKNPASEASVLDPFVAPDATSLVPVARALGWWAREVRDPAALEAALRAPTDGRPRWVEARVSAHGARESADFLAREIAARVSIP